MNEPRKGRPQSRGYSFRGKMIPFPPGTKIHDCLPRAGDEEPSSARRRFLLAGLLVAVLSVGVAIGRFLLP